MFIKCVISIDVEIGVLTLHVNLHLRARDDLRKPWDIELGSLIVSIYTHLEYFFEQ